MARAGRLSGAIVGSGGWSQLPPGYALSTGYASSTGARRPRSSATVRSVFVDPSVARRGVGSAIMRRVEADAARSGIRHLALTATLSGVALYAQKLGYRAVAAAGIDLGDGARLGCVKMEKLLDRVEAEAA